MPISIKSSKIIMSIVAVSTISILCLNFADAQTTNKYCVSGLSNQAPDNYIVLRNAPNKKSTWSNTINFKNGDTVEVIGDDGDYYKVRAQNGEIGWSAKAYIFPCAQSTLTQQARTNSNSIKKNKPVASIADERDGFSTEVFDVTIETVFGEEASGSVKVNFSKNNGNANLIIETDYNKKTKFQYNLPNSCYRMPFFRVVTINGRSEDKLVVQESPACGGNGMPIVYHAFSYVTGKSNKLNENEGRKINLDIETFGDSFSIENQKIIGSGESYTIQLTGTKYPEIVAVTKATGKLGQLENSFFVKEETSLFFVMNGTIVEAKGNFNGHGNNGVWKGIIDGGGPVTLTTRSNGKSITGTLAWQARESQIGFGRMYNTRD